MTDALDRVRRTKQKLEKLGPVLPGSISTQWNVCGKPDCRCKDPIKPRKHGPYYQLSFTIDGKSSTMFVKKGNLRMVRLCIKRYQRFKALNSELVKAYIQVAREGGLQQSEDKANG